jgi:hypothetical protein
VEINLLQTKEDKTKIPVTPMDEAPWYHFEKAKIIFLLCRKVENSILNLKDLGINSSICDLYHHQINCKTHKRKEVKGRH